MRIFPIDEPAEISDNERPLAQESPAPEFRPSQSRKFTRRILLALALCGLTIALAFLAFRYYQIRRVRGTIEPLVQNITLRTANDLNYAIEPQKITFKELFDKLDKDKTEIDSKIIDLQTIESRFSGGEIAASLNYAKACEALLRALESRYYKEMEMNSAVEWNRKTRDLYESSNYFGRYYAKKSYDEAVANFEKKSGEYDASVDDLAKAIKDSEATRSAITVYLSDRFLLDPALLTKLASGNEKIKRK
jgi:hypothetical protein